MDTNTVVCTLLVKWTKTRLLHMKSEICIKWIYATSFCFTGFINSLLSLGFWVPLSNISFACYLTHPVFIIFYIGLQETPIHYTDINFVSTSDTFRCVSSSLTLRYLRIKFLHFFFNPMYCMSPLFCRCTCSLVTLCSRWWWAMCSLCWLRSPTFFYNGTAHRDKSAHKRFIQLTPLILYSAPFVRCKRCYCCYR